MANRFDWNALEERINSILQEYGDLDNRTKALTVISLSAIMEIGVEESIDALTDGGNDRGVDALFVDNRDNRNDVHLVQSKCVKEFAKSRNNFPGREIDKVTSFVSDLLDEDMDALRSANEQLSQKIRDAIQAQRNSNATVTVHFVGNQKALARHESDRIESVFQRYTQVRFEMHDLDSLADFFLQRSLPSIDRELVVIDTNFFSRTDLNVSGMVCTVAATEVVEAIRSRRHPDQVELGIFDQNIRVYLKKSNRINREIIESALADTNHMFWYQNNGITITCDHMIVAPSRRSPTVTLKNIQIVNGGQTSNCLFEAAKKDPSKIENVLLLARIIETSSEDVKLAISESTNSQTPINARDLRSNDRQQRQLGESFADRGFFYERKSRQYSGKPRDKRIDALAAAQAYLAFGLGMPEVAKKDRGRIFGDLYDTVFSEEITVDKLQISYNLIQDINQKKSALRGRVRRKERTGKGELALIDGAFHVIFAIRQIILSNNESLWEHSISSSVIDQAIEIVQNLFLREQENDENFSSNRLFKDNKTKDMITKDVGYSE